MAKVVPMPKLGMTMEFGSINEWYVNVGDSVEEGELLVQIATDKTNLDVESPVTGTILHIFSAEAGAEVAVHAPLCVIGSQGESFETLLGGTAGPEQTVTDTHTDVRNAPDVATDASDERSVLATPAARRRARELNVDLQTVALQLGLVHVHRADVDAHTKGSTAASAAIGSDAGNALKKSTAAPPEVVRTVQMSEQTPPVATPFAASSEVRYGGMRKTIGDRMLYSVTHVPQVTLWTDVNMQACAELRQRFNASASGHESNVRISYSDFILKAAALALRRHRKLNASIVGDHIVYYENVDIGLAVALDDGLIVPVIRDVDKLTFGALHEQTSSTVARARSGQLMVNDFQGGHFTISNLGQYQIDGFTPIILHPQSGIIGVGRISDRAVAESGSIIIRPMVTLSLSFDHRLVDGAPASAFLQTVKCALEDPYQLMV
ncbi:MAG: dihydrolipoamide acetyltransferase family protein [Bacilli bacterium]